jgi:hypothetical protein
VYQTLSLAGSLVFADQHMSNYDPGNSSNNPYQATASSPPPAMLGNRKPTSITVFGIMNVVFAAMGLCGLAWLLIATQLPIEQGDNPLEEFTTDTTFTRFTIAQQVMGFVVTVLLLVAGIGLINGKPYGRKASIIYAIVVILLSLVTLGFNIAYIMLPALAAANEVSDGQEKMTLIIAGSAVGIQPICGWIYPILLLIFMNRAPVVNYMRAQEAPER